MVVMPPLCYRCGRLSLCYGFACDSCRSADTEDAPDLDAADARFQTFAGWCCAISAAVLIAILAYAVVA